MRARMARAALAAPLVAALTAACTVGPNYQRPAVQMPPAYRGPEPTLAGPSIGDVGWWSLFQDAELQNLIRTALVENHDLRIAVTRILQAQSQLTIVRSQAFPIVDATASVSYNRLLGDADRPITLPKEEIIPQGGFSAGWEIDFWGRVRRSTEAARADLLGSEEARRAVQTTLVADVAQAYFDLRTLDESLEISRRTLASRQQSLDLVRLRVDGGVAAAIDQRQAEVLLFTAARTIPDGERRIEQTENAINVLLGRPPGPIPRGRILTQQFGVPDVPVGVPSELLERRPDIRQAEQQLVAANALIGANQALLFPRVFISGFLGAGGFIIDGHSFGPFGLLNALPSVNLPLFNAGRLQAGVDLADARTREAVARYQQTIVNAVREVADGLVEQRKRRESRIQQEALAQAAIAQRALAQIRYEGGVSSYLEVQDAERQVFSAELDVVQAQRDELVSIIQIYRALGGGWQPEPGNAPPPVRTGATSGGPAPL